MLARLRELHATGAKFKAIAVQLSAEYKVLLTRNAVIGKAHRLQLELRHEPPKGTARERVKREKLVTIRPPPPLVPEPPPIPGQLTMMQLSRCTCHWPNGEKPPYTYCGEPTVHDSSFCREHYGRVYVKPRLV